MEKHRPEDDLFKKILEDHPHFEPGATDIDDMRRRLDQAESTPSQKGTFGWWIPFLLIPFILGNFYLFYQNHKLNAKINSLQSNITITQNDLIEKKNITYSYDTIYNIVYKDKIIERQFYRDRQGSSISNLYSPVLNNLTETFRTFAVLPPKSFYKNEGSSLLKYFPESSSDLLGGTAVSTLQKFNFYQEKNQGNSDLLNPEEGFNISNEFVAVPSLMSFLKEEKSDIPLFDIMAAASDHEGYKRSALYHVVPTGFQIGLQASPFGFSTLKEGKSMTSIGLLSEIEFGKQLRLQVGAKFTKISFEESDPIAQTNYPTLAPDNPSDILNEFYVTLNDLQIPISFKYLLREDKRWNPFFTLGMVATTPLRQSYKYEFVDTSFGEYSKSQSFNEGVFSIENFQGAVGMEFRVTKNIFAEASLSYLHDFKLNEGEFILLRQTGFNLGLKYKL